MDMILIKQHNSQQVAHLYEHIFCVALDDFFYENKLFPYLDFDIVGRTFRGVIYVKIHLYTDAAKRLAKKIPGVEIYFDEQKLNIAIIQLGAELQEVLGIAGEGNDSKKILAEELYVLDQQSWKDIDDVAVVDLHKAELIPGALYRVDGAKKLPTKKNEVLYSVDDAFTGSHRDVLPLFPDIAQLISASVRAVLYGQFGFYPDGFSFAPENQTAELVHSFRTAQSLKFSVNDVRVAVEDTIGELHKEKAFERLTGELGRVTDYDSDVIVSDPYAVYERTGVIIGVKGWQQIATKENCDMILAHMKVTIKVGDESTSFNVASALKL